MNKTLRLLLIIGSLPLLIAAGVKSSFTIEGVKGKLEANIQSRLNELAQTTPLNKEHDAELQLQVEKAMQPYGYFRPQISINRHKASIKINPGPRMLISSLEVQIKGEGAENSELNKALLDLPLAEGKPLNSAEYEDAKETLMNTAENQGYLRASFEKAEILIDRDRYTARITLLFNTGPQYYFGQVRFDPTYISPELLQRYVPFSLGQPYSTEKILALNSRLSNSGYFSNVLVTPQIAGEPEIPVDVHLQKIQRISYSLGIGFGTDTGIRGRAGFHIIPVNRAGHKFNAIALGSFNQNTLQAQYIIPGRNPVTDQYTITGNGTNLNYDSGISNSILLALAQQHNLSTFQRMLSINGLFESFRYTFQPNERKTIIFPKASFTWKQTSDKLFSPTGYNITLMGLAAAKAFLSQENFAQVSIDAKGALTIPSLRTRLYAHAIQGITSIKDINQLPLSLALLLGGAENLKAYSFNSIPPGKIISYAGFEIQKETWEHWYLVGFFDSGDVYMPRRKNSKNDIGGGFMWVSPVGPIKVGIAQAVDNRFARSERRPRLVVSMGPDL